MGNIAGLRYLLDTNILSALIRQPQGPVASTLARRGYATVCTSIVVAAEWRSGGPGLRPRNTDLRCYTVPGAPRRRSDGSPHGAR